MSLLLHCTTQNRLHPPRRVNNSTQIKQTQNDKATLKQHVCRSSFHLHLHLHLSVFSPPPPAQRVSPTSRERVLYRIKSPIRARTISTQLKSVVYIKAQVQRVYKADLDLITYDFYRNASFRGCKMAQKKKKLEALLETPDIFFFSKAKGIDRFPKKVIGPALKLQQ